MTASTMAQYLAGLPADRRAVHKAINENLPNGYEEGMQFGMTAWYVPLSLYPASYGENPKVCRSRFVKEMWRLDDKAIRQVKR